MATIRELYRKSICITENGTTDAFSGIYMPDLCPPTNGNPYDELFGRCREHFNDMVIPNILLHCGHFESVCETVDEFKNMLDVWTKTRSSVWNDLLRTTVQKYTLINNYDRTEEWIERRANLEFAESNNKNTVQSDNSYTSENSVSAYDSADYQPRDRTSGNSEAGSTGSGEASFNKSAEDDFERKVRVYGNIGVTTAQQMLEEERRLVQFNIVEYIVADFKKQFCILVY